VPQEEVSIMKFVTSTAIGLTLALGAMTVTAVNPALAKKQDAAPAGPNFSAAFRQAAQPLQKAITAKDYAAAKAALPAAQAAASTDDDKYQASLMALIIAQNTQDNAAMAAAADGVINSGKAPPDQLKQVLAIKGQIAYNSGDFAGSDAAFTKLLQTDPGDGDTAITLAQVKVREGRAGEALPIIDQAIQVKTSANQPVLEDWYQRGLAIAYDAKPPVPDKVIKYGLGLIAAYPTPKNWRTVLETYRETSKLDQQTDLDTMRLMRVNNALAGERDYYEYAQLASDKGFPGEAKAVIDEGMASNMVDNKALATSKALNEIKALAGSKVAADKASLPALDKRARTAPDGKAALNTADAYLGYGMFPEAVDLYKVALQKGGVDANVVNTRLGIALARSGQKAAALQAFGTVTGPHQPIAQYWTVWTKQQPG
jgi:tetratricopeptide (TPR) repeat protein